MLELRVVQGWLLKKVVEAIKDPMENPMQNAIFDCSSSGFSLQSILWHVALLTVHLRYEGLEHYRCDHNMSMGINLNNMSKMLHCANNDDIITIKAEDGADFITLMFESPTQEKISEFEMYLMDTNIKLLEIEEEKYQAIVKMPSADFCRICGDLSSIGDTVTISVTKVGLKFRTRGDIGVANITCKQNTCVDKPEEATVIEMNEPVSVTFGLKCLNSFTKATPLSNTVTISLSNDFAVKVEYKIAEIGYARFYLAPKVEGGEEDNTKPKD